MDVLISGSTGFFGRAILRNYPGVDFPNVKFTAVSRSPGAFLRIHPELAGKARWITGDIQSLILPPTSHGNTHLLHAAADSTRGPNMEPMERYGQIVEGTRRMLDVAVNNGIRRFLLTSSGGVYGKQPVELDALPEDYMGIPDPLNPGNVYGVSKRIAEHLCALYSEKYGLEVVIARCFAFVGEDLPLNVHFAIGNFIRDALWADEITVHGDGTQTRSYLDQRDLARWLLTLLEEGKAGEAYNVGSDRAISIADLAHLVRDLICPGKPVKILGAKIGSPDRSHYIPDIRKIESHLGLRPTISLEQSILDTAAVAKARGKPQ